MPLRISEAWSSLRHYFVEPSIQNIVTSLVIIYDISQKCFKQKSPRTFVLKM